MYNSIKESLQHFYIYGDVEADQVTAEKLHKMLKKRYGDCIILFKGTNGYRVKYIMPSFMSAV